MFTLTIFQCLQFLNSSLYLKNVQSACACGGGLVYSKFIQVARHGKGSHKHVWSFWVETHLFLKMSINKPKKLARIPCIRGVRQAGKLATLPLWWPWLFHQIRTQLCFGRSIFEPKLPFVAALPSPPSPPSWPLPQALEGGHTQVSTKRAVPISKTSIGSVCPPPILQEEAVRTIEEL